MGLTWSDDAIRGRRCRTLMGGSSLVGWVVLRSQTGYVGQPLAYGLSTGPRLPVQVQPTTTAGHLARPETIDARLTS